MIASLRSRVLCGSAGLGAGAFVVAVCAADAGRVRPAARLAALFRSDSLLGSARDDVRHSHRAGCDVVLAARRVRQRQLTPVVASRTATVAIELPAGRCRPGSAETPPPIVEPYNELESPTMEVEPPSMARTAEDPWLGVDWVKMPRRVASLAIRDRVGVVPGGAGFCDATAGGLVHRAVACGRWGSRPVPATRAQACWKECHSGWSCGTRRRFCNRRWSKCRSSPVTSGR